MPDKHSITCHRCGKEGATRFRILTGMSSDGVERTPDYDTIDLCADCMAGVIRVRIKEIEALPYEEYKTAKDFAEKWTTPIGGR